MQNLLHQDDSHATMRTLTQNVRPIAHLKNGRPCANSPLRVLGKPQRAASRAKEGEAVLTSDTSNAAEEWRPIVGFEGYYEVSNLGRVRTLPRTIPHSWIPDKFRTLKSRILRPNGKYNRVTLCGDGVRWRVGMHVLVLTTFVSERPSGMFACHNDGNTSNNTLSNLRWDTPKSNSADRVKHGTVPLKHRHWTHTKPYRIRRGPRENTANMRRGERAPWAKLSAADVAEIRRRYKKNRRGPGSCPQLAAEFGVSNVTIINIAMRKTWRHI